MVLEQFEEEKNTPAIYHRGRDPIGTILATRGVDVTGVVYLSFGEVA